MDDNTPGAVQAERYRAGAIAYGAVGAELCANCEEPLAGEPVYFDGEAFCCTGCVNGGPCICTYTTRDYTPPLAEADAWTGPATSADTARAIAAVARFDAPAAPPAPDAPAEPTAPPTVVLRVGSFADQLELLRFARDLEQGAEITEVSLIRGGDLADAWLAVHTPGVQCLSRALYALDAFELLSCTTLPGGMEARVRAIVAVEEEPIAEVLPPRQRPRIAWTDEPRAAAATPSTFVPAASEPRRAPAPPVEPAHVVAAPAADTRSERAAPRPPVAPREPIAPAAVTWTPPVAPAEPAPQPSGQPEQRAWQSPDAENLAPAERGTDAWPTEDAATEYAAPWPHAEPTADAAYAADAADAADPPTSRSPTRPEPPPPSRPNSRRCASRRHRRPRRRTIAPMTTVAWSA